jgi:hypothetical protein
MPSPFASPADTPERPPFCGGMCPPRCVEHTDSGRISAVALAKKLEPQLGLLVKLRFRPSLTATPNTVAWEALNERAEVVTGKLVLHAALAESEVASWAEVMVARAS